MSSIAAGTTTTTALVSTADTTGSLVLKTGASATTALTLDTSQNATFAGTVATATGTIYPLVSGTAVTLTTQTSVDFTGIPSTAKRITIMFAGASLSGTSSPLIQIGDAGGIESTGYIYTGSSITNAANPSVTSYTTGFAIRSATASNPISGHMIITLLGSNLWVASYNGKNDTNTVSTGAGDKTLSDTLTQVRITTVNGTDTLDAGTINIMWE